MTTFPRWRRTVIKGLSHDPGIVDDDWSLNDSRGQSYARIYKVRGGPNDAAWFWTVIVDSDGRPWNAGTGYATSGREAREACEARLGEGFRPAT